jgi:predicted GNAT superfamily acetyltransferase
MLMGAQRVGGVAAGAFDPAGTLVGFVFGFNGLRDGELAHWSYMLAVCPEAQGRGLGRRLKAFQRQSLLALGVRRVYWTYDPLVAANAHLNLTRLGARAIQYVPDMYGADTRSDLHRELGTDRFVVEWRLDAPEVEQALARGLAIEPGRLASASSITMSSEHAPAPELPDADAVLIEIPDDILDIRNRSPRRAARWRATTRHAFLHYLGRAYTVSTFRRGVAGEGSVYLLSRE